jgi:acyl-coenzyme A thioesterase PaaI-like protein
MNAASPLMRLLPSIDDPGNPIRDAWNRMQGLPGGKALFTRMIGTMAPYTGTMGAKVEELSPGYSRVSLPDRRAVRNHLRCIHAIALANLAELTGNVAIAYSLPDDARFIVAGMSIDYGKKARGTITGECRCPVPDSAERREYEVPVTMKNAAGEVVATATLRTLVGPKKG